MPVDRFEQVLSRVMPRQSPPQANHHQRRHRRRRHRRHEARNLPLSRRIYRHMIGSILGAFRSGLVLVYIGVLMVVIGYHNPWVQFAK